MTFTWQPTRLVLVGSVIGDLMMRVPQLPERGADVLASETTWQAGGGFNVLAAARRMGLPGALAGRVGKGPIGSMIASALERAGIVPLLPRAEGDSGFCIGFIEPDGERTFATSPGVESALTERDLSSLQLAKSDAVYLSGYELCYPVSGPAIANWLGSSDCSIIFDPGPLAGQIPAELLLSVLARTRVLTLNAREARMLSFQRPPGMVVITRDGPAGCQISGVGEPHVQVPAPEVKALDTTGAGDAHTGALLAELSRGSTLLDAVRTANRAAAFAVTREGSATGPTRAQLDGWDG